jgi:hypothetical protein
MMRATLLMMAVCLVSGCVVYRAPSIAVVTRMDAATFRRCAIETGDSQETLRADCGEPLRVMKSANTGAECWLYDTRTLGFATDRVLWVGVTPKASHYVACFETREAWKDRPAMQVVSSIVPVDTSTAP